MLYERKSSAAASEFCEWIHVALDYRLILIAQGFVKLPTLYLLIKQESITSLKLGSWDFWQIANSILNKVNLLYLLYSTTQACCLLYLIKQNCLLKTFLITLI